MLKKPCSMSSVHLNVVKLEGDRQRGLEPSLAIFSPHHHRVAELISVLIHYAIQFGSYHGRSSHNHSIIHKTAFAIVGCRFGQNGLLFLKNYLIFAKWDVA